MDLLQFLSSAVAQALGETILYSLLQSCIIFLCVWILLKMIRSASSKSKYALCYFAYMAMAAAFIATFIYKLSVLPSAATGETFNQITSQQLLLPAPSSTIFSFSYLDHFLPFFAGCYVVGSICFALRLGINYLQTDQLKRKGIYALSPGLQQQVFDLLEKVNIRKKVLVYFSCRISSPIMIGFLKPVILLPFSIVNNLSPQQFEAILLHELAHIRRSDFFWNIIQSVADTLLFFNPFGIWISKIIREEREKCCDEMVLQSSDRYHYARALLALRQPLQKQPLLLGSVGKKSHLLNRIKYIIEMKHNRIYFSQKLFGFLLIMVATFSVAWLTPKEENGAFIQKQNNYSPNLFRDVFNSTILQLQIIPNSIPSIPKPLPASVFYSNSIDTPPLPPAPPVSSILPVVPTPPVAPLPPVPPLPPLPPSPSTNVSDSFPDTTYFNSKEWKQQQEAIRKSTEAMKKYFQSKEWKNQQELIKKNGLAMKKYFNSPEWKNQLKQIQKTARQTQEYFNSAEWKKQQAEIERNAANIHQYFNSPAWKKQQEEIQKNGQQINEYFNSPEWKKQQDLIRHSTDSLVTYFNSKAWKQQQEELKKAMSDTKAFFKTDEWKGQQEQLKKMMEQNKEATKALERAASEQKNQEKK